MKQARKAGMTLLQRLGTDAHYAFNCAVQDLTPRCMHWITVLGNVVLPNIKRTREEIRTGKIRQYKARMCLVAYEEGQMQTIVVDDHVLIWYKNRFYRANQFAAAYALIPVAERFEVLSVANTTFQSLRCPSRMCMPTFSVMSTISCAPSRRQRTRKAEADPCLLPSSKIQMSPGLRVLGMDHIRGPRMVTVNRSGTISTTSGLTRKWEDWRRRNQGHQYRDRRWSGYR